MSPIDALQSKMGPIGALMVLLVFLPALTIYVATRPVWKKKSLWLYITGIAFFYAFWSGMVLYLAWPVLFGQGS